MTCLFIYNPLVDLKGGEGSLDFVHRGEIYALKDKTGMWRHSAEDLDNDWFTSKVINHPKLSDSHNVAPAGKGQLSIKYSKIGHQAKVANIEKAISNVSVYCASETKTHDITKMPSQELFKAVNPICSIFSIKFKDPGKQLFRISFHSTFGIEKYESEVGLTIEGPDLVRNAVLNDVFRMASGKTKDDLIREMNDLSDEPQDPCYEVVVLGHPEVPLTIGRLKNTSYPIFFPVETKGTPFKSAACRTRASFFNFNTKGISIGFHGNILRREGLPQFSEDFLKDLCEMRRITRGQQ